MMNSRKRALSGISQADTEIHTETKKVKSRHDMYMQPGCAATQEWDMEVDSNYPAQEDSARQSTINDGVHILENAQGISLDKCTINAASRDIVFITKHETSIDKYKQWLTPPDPSTNFINALKNHLDNTGSWLLNSPAYLEWKHSDNSFLWIHGISGSGKTILCSTLIQAIQQQTDNKSSGLAYFFCDVSDINKGTARGLLCSLVFTLSTPQNQSVLKVLFEKCKDGHQKPSDHDLYEVLRSYLSGFQDVYLFIDALDECSNLEEVLELVKLINRWSIRSCHLLVTSRKELPIVNSLRQAMPTELDLTSMPVHQDIAQYIDHMLFFATELKTWNPNAKELIKLTLMEKGAGMFRWVACQLEELKHCSKSLNMLRQKLNGLPTTLESTYDQILTRIEEADAMNAKKLLLWLTFSERPIHIEDLAIIVEFDVERQEFDVDGKLDYPDDVLKICSSLVTKMKDKTVQFAHASIKEYFQSNKRKIGSSVEVDPCFGHYFIGQCSLAYIVQRRQDERYWESLLKYAAQFWPKHILISKQESAVMNQIINLFESESLLYWVDAHIANCFYHNQGIMIYPNYLQIAALHGLIETVKWLMLQPVNNVACMEALSAAASNGHVNIVTLLIEKGKIRVESEFYYQALSRASQRGQNEAVRLLCEHVKDNDVLHKFINKAICQASRPKNKENIAQLIDCGGPNFKINSRVVSAATWDGDIELVQLLLQKESDEKQRKELIVQVVEKAAYMYSGHKALIDFVLKSELGLSGPSTSLIGLMYDESYVMHRKELLAKALNTAAQWGQKDIVETVLKSGVDMNAKANALASASREGHVHIVELLLDSGIEVNVCREQINCAFSAAVYKGHEGVVRFLLGQGANSNIRKYEPNLLYSASHRGYKNIVQILIDNGADVNVQGGKYGYPIWAAMLRGYNEIVDLLVQHGASPSIHSGYDDKALVAASRGGYRNIVELLLDEGVDSDAYDDALISALEGGHKDIIKLLLEKGACINQYGRKDWEDIPLHVASADASTDIVRLLLEWGADVNIVGGSWGTALHAASSCGKKDSVQLLLEWGANVNILGGAYHYPLIAASYEGHKSIVELLLQWGADVNLHSDGGHPGSALIAALIMDNEAIAEMLLSHGADVNFCDEKYGSALIQAALFGNKDIIEILLQSGADVNIQGKYDGSALYAAANSEMVDDIQIVQLLLAHGAKYLGPIDDTCFWR